MSRSGAIAAVKRTARAAARARRDAVRAADHDGGGEAAANARLLALLAPWRGRALSAYVAINSELSPRAAMTGWAVDGPVCLPVVTARGAPLAFRRWAPGCAMRTGLYGAAIPADGQPCTPAVVIVPLLAFDRAGGRLGYGGGYYDRTLARLRAAAPTIAVGLAYDAQESAGPLALEATDAALDAIVTETATHLPSGREIALAPPDARP